MRKLQIGTVLIALSLSLQAPCALAGQLPEEERQIKRESLEESKMELNRRRTRLVAHREGLTQGLADIEKQLTILNTDTSPSTEEKKASTLALSKELLEQALDQEMDMVEDDVAIHELDRRRLDIDKALFKLEELDFNDRYKDVDEVVAEKLDTLKDLERTPGNWRTSAQRERDLFSALEPVLLNYWGKKRIDKTELVMKTRESRLKLWLEELKAHSAFLKAKHEDNLSGTKRAELRRKLLNDYFRLKESRQRLNNELIMSENDAWQASERMKYELGSLYRRLSYLNRALKKRGDKLPSLAHSRFRIGNTDNLKVGEYMPGIVFDDFYNWGSRVSKVITGSSAEKIGLKPGDELVFVDKLPVIGSDRSFKTLLVGPKDKEVEITVMSAGNLYRVPLNLDYRPEEKTHPEILKALKEADQSKDTEAMVRSRLEEINYKSRYSRDHSVADSSVEELMSILKEHSELSGSLKVAAYAGCSVHYLNRMGESLSRARTSEPDSQESSVSAEFLNQADEAATRAIEAAAKGKSASLADAVALLDLAGQYQKLFDFRHIGTADTLKAICDRIVVIAGDAASESPYDAASLLKEMADVYELSLKDYRSASQALSKSNESFLLVLPEEAQEVTSNRLVLSRTYTRQDKLVDAIDVLESRLSSLDSIEAFSAKAEELMMYDYVVTLKELGKLYRRQGDDKNALRVADAILESYGRLDALEDSTYVDALLLKGRSTLAAGKAKKALPYLTEALRSLPEEDRAACLIELADAYGKLKRANELRLISVLLRDHFVSRLSKIEQGKSARLIGDQSVQFAELLDEAGEPDEAVSFLDLALSAYTVGITSSGMKTEADQMSEKERLEMKALALHLAAQLKKIGSVLASTGRDERATSVTKFTEELEAKLSGDSELDLEWLVRAPQSL